MTAEEKAEAALTHVRELHQFFAELRSANFNFYLILLGALAAGFLTSADEHVRFGVSAGAAFISVVFLGLDSRNIEMIGDARLELERLESTFDVKIHRPDSWADAQAKPKLRRFGAWFRYSPKARLGILSHKILYRAVFLVAYLTAVIILCHYPWQFGL